MYKTLHEGVLFKWGVPPLISKRRILERPHKESYTTVQKFVVIEKCPCFFKKKSFFKFVLINQPSSQFNLWEVLQEGLPTRMPKVCQAVIAANGGFFDDRKVWRTQLLFQLKIIIYNRVDVLTIFPNHLANHFMYVFMVNKDISKWPQTFEQ